MDLSGTVARVGAICRRFGIDSLAPQLAACEEMLKGGGVVDVAVLGQFKAGKSSFLNGLVAGCRGYLILAERAAGAADAARADLVAALERERRGFGSVKGEIRLLCNHLQAEVRTAADERFHAYHGEATRRVTANLREAMAGWKGHLGRMTREFEEWLADVMMEEMGAVSLHGEGHLAGFLFRAQASVERSVRAFVDRLGREIENALGIRFEGARFDPQVEEPAHPDVRLSPTFDTYFERFWFLIPMPVFRPLVRRHFLRRIP